MHTYLPFCIAFTGCHGSGKTTLANWIHNQYNLPLYINQTRQFITDNYNGDLNSARKDVINYQLQLLKNKTKWESANKDKGFITDRTTIDNLAYLLAYGPADTPDDLIRNYQTTAINHLSTYDLIFYLPPIFNTPDNPLSPPMPIEKLKIDFIIQGILTHLLTPCYNTFKIVRINTTDLYTRQMLIGTSIDNLYYEHCRT